MGGGFWTGVVVGWLAGAVMGYLGRKLMGGIISSKGGEIGQYYKLPGGEEKKIAYYGRYGRRAYHAKMRYGQFLFNPERVLLE